jgi:hypothetical protein
MITSVGLVATALARESAARAPGAFRSLLPRIGIPSASHREFAAAAPVIAAVWMLSGLTGGLAPSMVRTVFMLDSAILNGLSGFVSPAASAVVAFLSADLNSRRAIRFGVLFSIVGAAAIAAGATLGSLGMMMAGQAIAGAAFGATFTAALRLVMPLAAVHERAGLAAAVYSVSYLAFGLPMVIAGRAAESLGTVVTVNCYSGFTALCAVASLAAQLRLTRGGGRVS